MSLSFRDLLLTPSSREERVVFSTLPGASEPTTAEKAWAKDYDLIAQELIACVVNPSLDQLDALFGGLDDLDRKLLGRFVHPLDETYTWIQSEGDCAAFFHTHVSHPVQLAFPFLVPRSEAGPLGATNYPQTVDFSLGHGDNCVLCGEFKKHGIIKPSRWTGNKSHNPNRIRLGREIRG